MATSAETTTQDAASTSALNKPAETQNDPQGSSKVTNGCIEMELKDGKVVASKVDGKCDCPLDLSEGVTPKDAMKLSKMLFSVAQAAG